MRHIRPSLLGAACAVFLLGVLMWHDSLAHELKRALIQSQAAAVFFVQSVTVADLHRTYGQPHTLSQSQQKIRILIVPGHEPQSGGTAFSGYFERDVVVDIADELAALLASNPRFEVMVSRTKTEWHPILSHYFDAQAKEILAFKEAQAALMAQHVQSGRIAVQGDATQVKHNTAPSDTTRMLYGINKWASENNIAITLHLHLNDHGGRRSKTPGMYAGYVVYVPNHQYSNAVVSKHIGEAVAARLSRFGATSTMPQEKAGVVEDQELIAIGSNNSADAASILIEYSYIYERQLRDPSVRTLAVSQYAHATFAGLQDFFNDSPQETYGTPTLPYTWERPLQMKAASADTYALQTALRTLDLYPPHGQNLDDCPISGYAGECTVEALKGFQGRYGLSQTGVLDRETRQTLNRMFAQAKR